MTWKKRKVDEANIPPGRLTPDYGANSGDYSIRMHHGGKFLENLGSRIYWGGELTHFDFCNSDEISMLEIDTMAREAGCTGDLVFYFGANGPNDAHCVRLLHDDEGAVNLIQFLDEHRMVGIFVKHVIEERSESDVDSESVADDATELPSVDEGLDFVGEDQSEPVQKNNVSEAIIDRDDNSDDSDTQSFGEDSDDSEVLLDSDYEVSDDDVLFETNIDPEVEWDGSNKGKGKAVMETRIQTRLSRKKDDTYRGRPVHNERKSHHDHRFDVGETFKDPPAFRKAVREHAIRIGRDVRFPINLSFKVQARCKHKTCPWVIYASKIPGEDTMVVRTYCSKHECPRSQKVSHANAQWVADNYKMKIWTDPAWPVDSMMAVLQDDHKIHFNKHTMYKAKKIVQDMAQGTDKEEYAKLWDYAEEIKRSDPQTTVKIKSKLSPDGKSSRFKRFYICWGALKKGMLDGCRPIIFLDGCHLKSTCGGILLTAVGLDPNNCMYPFAYAVVEKEKMKSWRWFLRLIMDDLNINNPYFWTIMSDKQKGLVDAVDQVMPGSEHRFCVMHMYKNFKLQHKGLLLKNLLWKAARATRVVDFENAMNELKEKDKAAFEWLASRPASHWSKSHFSTTCKSDVLLNNMSESFNALILKARRKPIVSMLEHIRHILMRRVHMRRDLIEGYNSDLCPKINKLLEEITKKSMEFISHWNGLDQFEIEGCYGTRFKMHIGERSCSCRRWELTGIPCAHAVSGLFHLGHKPEQYVHAYYRKETFKRIYSHLMPTLNGSDMWPKTSTVPLLPPVMSKLPGRPKKHARKKDESELKKGDGKHIQKLSKKGVIMSCGICKKTDHNARTCPQKPNIPAVGPKKRKVLQKRRGKKSAFSSTKNVNMASSSSVVIEEMRQPSRSTRPQISSPSRSTRPQISSPSRNTRSQISSPSRNTRSQTSAEAVHVSNMAETSKRKKTLGLKRKLPVKRKQQDHGTTTVPMHTRSRISNATSQDGLVSTQTSSVLSKPWVPDGRSVTHSVRFSKLPPGKSKGKTVGTIDQDMV